MRSTGSMANANAQTRDIPSLSTRAVFTPGSVNEENRTVELTWTTGARVMRGFFDRFWEELSLDPKHVRMKRLNNGAPFLDNHDMQSGANAVVGVVESARLEKDRGIAVVRFAKAEDDPEADKIFRKIKDGILQNVSVGYRVYRLEKVEDGADKIPVMRATDWEPHEISVVPSGADDGAGFRSNDQKPNQCVIITQEKRTMDENTTPGTQPPPAAPHNSVDDAIRAATAARTEAAAQAAATQARAVEAAMQAERERSTEIRRLVRSANLGDDLADRFIRENAPLDVVRTAVLNQLINGSDAVQISAQTRFGAGDDARDKFVRGASAALFEQAGLGQMVRDAAKVNPEKFKDVAFDPGEFRGFKPSELARLSLERRGVKTGGMSRMDMIGMAFTHRSGYQSTSDFAVLFENVMYKSVLAAYAITPDTWRRFCKTDTVADFRPSNRFRTGSLGVLDSVNENGEFKNKVIPDGQKTSIATATKGNIIALTRQTILNDDMGALSDMATKLGRAAKLTIETDVYALLALNGGLGPTMGDGQPFFHSANRGNVNGTASALTAAGIDADRVIMAAQKDISNNEYLDLRPAILLVASGQGAAARVLNGAPYNPLDNRFQQPNPVNGLFRDIIDTPRFTGTRRYLFTDPSVAAAIVVAFLEGQGEAPVLDSENGWRVDGVEWKVRLDAKAQVFDPKAAITNAGA